ncbi:MAG: autotransporter-associated beta strand repeat-containing protein [Marinilabiliaceae bacterium]|nr:autotransporter-associated beta strand repeat-containing protein [Marinilabiliaceae bacterium]
MTESILKLRKAVITATIVLLTAAGAYAQGLNWSGTQNFSSNQTISQNITLTGNTTVFVSSGVEVIVSGVISSSSGYTLTKTGSGLLIFTGENTYTGTTTISAGQLRIGNSTATGRILSSSIVNNAEMGFWRNNDYTIAADISGTGTVYKSNHSGAKLIYTGNNTYAGATGVHNGTLQIGDGTSGKLTNSDVTLTLSTAILRFEPGESTNFTKAISGAGKVEYKGNSGIKQLDFSTPKTYTGTTTIEAGWFHITYSGTVAIGNIIVESGGVIIFNAGDNDQTYSGAISGDGSLTKWGGGKLTLTGFNDYTGSTGLYGTLQVGNGTSGSISYTSNVTLGDANAILRFEVGGEEWFDAVISGPGKVEYKGIDEATRTLYLTADNTYTGTTTVESDGILYLGSNTIAGSVAGNIILNNNSGVCFYRTNEHTYSGVISGAGDVYKVQTNKTILTGNNTYTGQTYVTAGTLQIGNGTSGTINYTSGVSINANAILRFEVGDEEWFDKVISGEGNVEYKGIEDATRTLFLTANNTYTGTTTVESDGILYIGSNTTTGSVVGKIILNNNAGVCFWRSNLYSYSGIISGEGFVRKQGSSTLFFDKTHTYTGFTEIYGGTLTLTGAGYISQSAGLFLKGAGTLNIEAADKTIQRLTSESSGDGSVVDLGYRTLTINTPAGFTDFYGGDFTGAGGVTKTGGGTLNLGNDVPYSAAGTLLLGGGTLGMSQNWQGNFTQNEGTTFNVNGNVQFGGDLELNGGNINMNITGLNSKITAEGDCFESGITTINISPAVAPANQVLIEADSGLEVPYYFSLNMPDYNAKLVGNGTQLLLSEGNTPIIGAVLLYSTSLDAPYPGLYITSLDQPEGYHQFITPISQSYRAMELINDVGYVIRYNNYSGFNFGTFNVETGDFSQISEMISAYSMAWNPINNEVYISRGSTENSFGKLDITTGEFTPIGNTTYIYFITIDNDGICYAIRWNLGYDFGTVELSTGDFTKIATISSGSDQYLASDLSVNRETNEIYHFFRPFDTNRNDYSILQKIDKTTGEVTIIGDFVNIVESGVIGDTYYANAPAAVTNFTVTPGNEGALNATLEWTNPTVTISGDPLTSITAVKVYHGNNYITTIYNPTPGTTSNYNYSAAAASNYTFKVVPENDAGKGISTSKTVWIGLDVPAAPENVTLSINENGDATLTWDAPATGLHGAYFTQTGLVYDVFRMYDNVQVATSQSGLTFSQTLTEIGTYSYKVVAKNASGDGGSQVSNIADYCTVINSFPWNFGFEVVGTNFPGCWAQEYVSGYIDWVIVSATTGTPATAHSGNYKMRMQNNQTAARKTMLITPPVNLTSLTEPVLTFWHTQAQWANDQDELRIFYKTWADDEWTQIAEYTANVPDWTERKILLPEKSNDYYIAFEGTTRYGYGIQLDDISISEAPTVPIIRVTPQPVNMGTIYNNLPYNTVKVQAIENNGGGTLNVTSYSAPENPEISVSELPMSVEQLSSEDITILVDGNGLPVGPYTGEIILSSNCSENPEYTVNISGNVAPAIILQPLYENWNAGNPPGWINTRFSRQTTGGVDDSPYIRANIDGSAILAVAQTPFVMMGDNPTMSFEFKAYNYSAPNDPTDATNLSYRVDVSNDNGFTWNEVYRVEQGDHIESDEYQTITVDVSEYAGELCQFRLIFNRHNGDFYVCVDEVYIGTQLQHDLVAVSIAGDSYVEINNTGQYTVTVRNNGSQPINADQYTVKLFKEGDIEIGSLQGVTLTEFENADFVFTWTPTVVEPTFLYGFVDYPNDDNHLNNSTANFYVISGTEIPFTVNITTNTGASVVGAEVYLYSGRDYYELIATNENVTFPAVWTGTYNIEVYLDGFEPHIAEDIGIWESFTYYVVLQNVHITTNSLSEVVVYPNPTSGKFSVRHCGLDPQSPQNNGMLKQVHHDSALEIFDIAGRLVHREPFTVNRETLEIDISHLPNGLYFVKVGGEMVKVVKK